MRTDDCKFVVTHPTGSIVAYILLKSEKAAKQFIETYKNEQLESMVNVMLSKILEKKRIHVKYNSLNLRNENDVYDFIRRKIPGDNDGKRCAIFIIIIIIKQILSNGFPSRKS